MSGIISPFFCYYGGKWRAGLKYPFPVYDHIVEPFAGSAGYSTRYFDRKITLVDSNPIICGLWHYLIHASSADILALPDVRYDQTVDDLNVTQEAKWLIGFWLNKGTVSPCKRPSAWMRTGKAPNSWWGKRVREKIATQIEYIRHWRVIQGSYENVRNGIATWFVDPPYHSAGKYYTHSNIEYSELGKWCRALSGQVIVCEHSGANWLPFLPFTSIQSNPSKRGKGYSHEVIWTNDHPRG